MNTKLKKVPKLYSTSKKLTREVKLFLKIKKYRIIDKIRVFDTVSYGWGRKRSGIKAVEIAHEKNSSFVLLEDGFIRSIGLGVDGSASFSLVEDDVGIYYDSGVASKLENLLNVYTFEADGALMSLAREARALLVKECISKYNSARELPDGFFEDGEERVLIIAQTAGDASLAYGQGNVFSTDEMITAAHRENPQAKVYLKVHPDVLSGKKDSDIDLVKAQKQCVILSEDVNPISLLKHFSKVYTKTSQMGFEALLVGCECVCFGMPFYAGWGITDDRVSCARRQRVLSVDEVFAAAYILYTRYVNPYTKEPSDIMDTMKTIVKYKVRDALRQDRSLFFGFSTWKHPFMHPFLTALPKHDFVNPLFKSSLMKKAMSKGLNEAKRVYIWGKKEFDEVEAFANEKKIQIYRIEDGFIRSVGLGSDLTQPYSLVIDSRGIYFDPSVESDLEHLLNFHDFSEEERSRAKTLRAYLLEKKLSKYNNYANVELNFPKDKTLVLVPGQVEDDASIQYGAKGMTNLSLLKEARRNAPQAYIIYKPHPDVLSGNRLGQVKDSEALKYCNEIVTKVSLDSVLALCDEVHTMTSLVGFEALMRGLKVYTYGLPFYAGWGLSVDRFTCDRRQRVLDINELTAAALILYPHYIDPLTLALCEVEVTLEGLELERKHYQNSFFYRSKKKLRNFISRKSQLVLRMLK